MAEILALFAKQPVIFDTRRQPYITDGRRTNPNPSRRAFNPCNHDPVHDHCIFHRVVFKYLLFKFRAFIFLGFFLTLVQILYRDFSTYFLFILCIVALSMKALFRSLDATFKKAAPAQAAAGGVTSGTVSSVHGLP